MGAAGSRPPPLSLSLSVAMVAERSSGVEGCVAFSDPPLQGTCKLRRSSSVYLPPLHRPRPPEQKINQEIGSGEQFNLQGEALSPLLEDGKDCAGDAGSRSSGEVAGCSRTGLLFYFSSRVLFAKREDVFVISFSFRVLLVV